MKLTLLFLFINDVMLSKPYKRGGRKKMECCTLTNIATRNSIMQLIKDVDISFIN